MLPPRDYPDSTRLGISGSRSDETPSVTVRTVLDRRDAKKPISDEMIHTAVTNLFTADGDITTESQTRQTSTRASVVQASPVRVPKALTALINTVRRY